MAVLEVSDAVIVIIFVLKVANPVGICVDTVIEWVICTIGAVIATIQVHIPATQWVQGIQILSIADTVIVVIRVCF